jgi:UDP-glucose 4-epimerase
MKILVVGGAGYVGSHCVRQLVLRGDIPVVLDNLVFGHRGAVNNGLPFYEGEMGDSALVERIIRKEKIDTVMHFAAFAYVGESVEDPIKYYINNVANTLRLLEVIVRLGVGRFVFSSTCATYGVPGELPISEEFEQNPVNPYGQTKLDIENALRYLSVATGLRSASFRYFNAAGATADGSIGEDHDPETHLIPLAIQAATGRREVLEIYGEDYDTPDGTCLRDFVHVDDLADAHLRAVDLLNCSAGAHYFNLGTGRPYSVRDIIATVEEISGLKVPVRSAARRHGDAPALWADASLAKLELDWQPEYESAESMVATAWDWHRENPDGYAK